jgi:hypothetical protein
MPPPIVALASNTVPVSLVRMIGVLLDPECSPIIEEQLILACDFRATASLVGGKHQVRREQGLMVA